MNDISSDDIFLLKQRLAEQEALIHALQEKLSNREREIDRQYSVRCVRPAPVSRSLNHYPVTKSDCCLRRRAARTAAVH